MVVTRSSRAKFTDLPPEVISTIVAAARPDEAAVSAGLSATCRSLHNIVLSTCTAIKLRRFGRGQQIAPLLQHLTGAAWPYSIPICCQQCCRLHDAACIACSLSQLCVWMCVQDCSSLHWPAACLTLCCGRSSSNCSSCNTSPCRKLIQLSFLGIAW